MAETTKLEQKCLRPGLWLIEGWYVRRLPRQGYTRGSWSIARDENAPTYEASATVSTLSAAREWIWEKR